MTHQPLRRTVAVLVGSALLLVGGALATTTAHAAVPTPADLDGLPSPGTSAPPMPTPTPTPTMIGDVWGCVAHPTVVASWPGGFVASVRVRNVSGFMSVETWTVSVSLPEGSVTSSWNATPVEGSPATFTPAPWSPRVGVSGSAEFGFLGAGSPEGLQTTCRPY